MAVNPAEVQKYLSGVRYPAAQEELFRIAQLEGANSDVLGIIRSLPLEVYYSPADVSKAIGLIGEI
jgi:hypothetical protein